MNRDVWLVLTGLRIEVSNLDTNYLGQEGRGAAIAVRDAVLRIIERRLGAVAPPTSPQGKPGAGDAAAMVPAIDEPAL